MAELLLKHSHGRTIYVDSCGLHNGDLDPFAVEVMREIGIDVSRHQSKTFAELDDSFFDLIVTLSSDVQHRVEEMMRGSAVELELWPISDATAEQGSRDRRLEAYRFVRDSIQSRILARFPASSTAPR